MSAHHSSEGTLPPHRRRRRGRGINSCGVSRTALIILIFWVKEAGQTGTTARHNTQNRQKCCDSHSPFKSKVYKGYNFPCSVIITQITRRGRRRISVPKAYAPGVAVAVKHCVPLSGALHGLGVVRGVEPQRGLPPPPAHVLTRDASLIACVCYGPVEGHSRRRAGAAASGPISIIDLR